MMALLYRNNSLYRKHLNYRGTGTPGNMTALSRITSAIVNRARPSASMTRVSRTGITMTRRTR